MATCHLQIWLQNKCKRKEARCATEIDPSAMGAGEMSVGGEKPHQTGGVLSRQPSESPPDSRSPCCLELKEALVGACRPALPLPEQALFSASEGMRMEPRGPLPSFPGLRTGFLR